MKIPALTTQVFRFLVIGVSNTVVDFAVLNGLIFTFGLDKHDPKFTYFKIISFIVAVTNSFIWNKTWVFGKEAKEKEKTASSWRELAQFMAVSIFGFLLNIGSATVVFWIGNTIFPAAAPIIFANLGAVVGAGVSLVSNFFGYKYFVFKTKTARP